MIFCSGRRFWSVWKQGSIGFCLLSLLVVAVFGNEV
jgi:hypothetical protein